MMVGQWSEKVLVKLFFIWVFVLVAFLLLVVSHRENVFRGGFNSFFFLACHLCLLKMLF